MKSAIKKSVPQPAIQFVRSLQGGVGKVLLSLANKRKKLSDLYYFLSGDFSREHQSVLKGRQAYYKSLRDIGKSCALLRRNIHRLEKGLIMRPRRSLFAEGFIKETVDCYKNAVKSNELASAEKKWATDVLDEYFEIIGSSPVIDKSKEVYEISRKKYQAESLESAFPSFDGSYKPYQYGNLLKSNISFNELKKLFIQRRSVRWYKDEPVAYEKVQQAANIASFAPSACNRQPYRFFFCNSKSKTVDIAKCAGGTTGFAENIPAIIAIIGDLSAYPYERDRHLIYIDGSLAAMQLMLALETLGLSTCSINWPEVETSERKIRKIIELKDYERVVMLLAIGYADDTGGVPYSQKKENSLILENISS